MYANPSSNANPRIEIPQHRDPVARFCLIALVMAVVAIAYLAPATTTNASVGPEQIILIATSTPGQLPAAIGQPPAAIDAPLAPQPTQSLEQAFENTAPRGELALVAPTMAPVFEMAAEPEAAEPAPAVGIQAPSGDRLYWPDGSFTVGDSQLRYYPASDGTIAEARLNGSEPNVAEAPDAPPIEENPNYVDPAVYATMPTAAPLPEPSGRIAPRNPNRTR